MKLRLFLLLLFSSTTVDGCSKGINPTCSTRSIEASDDGNQLAEIQSSESFIKSIEDNPALLYNTSYQKPVVTLTAQQEKDILRNFPEIFLSRESFEAEVLQTTTPGTRTKRQLQRRFIRICEPVRGSDPLRLALKPNGDVVQLVQFADKNQWILEESCAQQTDPFTRDFCNVTERHVRALFINLSGVLLGDEVAFDYSYVIVHSCVTVRLRFE